jgi:hypothetical protein
LGTSSGVTTSTGPSPAEAAASVAPRAAAWPNEPVPAPISTRPPGTSSATASITAAGYRLVGEAIDTSMGILSTSSALPPWFQITRSRSAAHRPASPASPLP